MISGLVLSLIIGFLIGHRVTPYRVQHILVANSTSQTRGQPGDSLKAMLNSIGLDLADWVGQERLSGSERASTLTALGTPLSRSFEVRQSKDANSLMLSVYGRDKNELVIQANELAQRLCDGVEAIGRESLGHSQEHEHMELQVINRSLQAVNGELDRLRKDLGVRDLDDEVMALTAKRLDLQSQIDGYLINLDSARLQITNFLQEIIRHHPTILSLRQALNEALLRYTEAHPKVQELRNSIAILETRLRDQGMEIDADILSHGESLAQELYAKVVKLRGEVVVLQGKLEILERTKEDLESRIGNLLAHQSSFAEIQTEVDSLELARAQTIKNLADRSLLLANPSSSMRVLRKARLSDVQSRQKWLNGALGGLGLVVLNGGLMAWSSRCRKLKHDHIGTGEELARISGLPSLGELEHTVGMKAADYENWAFDALTRLRGSLRLSANGALVCGFISSQHGEGRSTWVNALAQAGRKQGLRVLTVNAGSVREGGVASTPGESAKSTTLSKPNNLDLVSAIERSLTLDNQGTTLEMPSLQWIWNLDNRRQWRQAIEKCQSMEDAVVLIELPPVVDRESVLLAEGIPNVIWLSGRGQVRSKQTKSEIDMLKCAKICLVGTAFNSPHP